MSKFLDNLSKSHQNLTLLCCIYLFNFNNGKSSFQGSNNSIHACETICLIDSFQKYFSKSENISYLSETQKTLSMFHNKNPNKNIPKDV